MLSHFVHRSGFQNLSSVYQFSTLFTLIDKMAPKSNVIQLTGMDQKPLQLAVELLRQGEIIAVPTDTVYGLAVNASNSSAIDKLYKVKGRDANKPLAICVCAVSEVKMWGVTEDLPKGLLTALLPGPVTVLLNRRPKLNPDLNPGLKKVGIRVPETTRYPFLDFVTDAVGYPLALTSANRSNEPNCIRVEEFKDLWPMLGAVFDVNANAHREVNQSREGSTIVDLSETGKFKITRPGIAFNKTLATLNKFGLENMES